MFASTSFFDRACIAFANHLEVLCARLGAGEHKKSSTYVATLRGSHEIGIVGSPNYQMVRNTNLAISSQKTIHSQKHTREARRPCMARSEARQGGWARRNKLERPILILIKCRHSRQRNKPEEYLELFAARRDLSVRTSST